MVPPNVGTAASPLITPTPTVSQSEGSVSQPTILPTVTNFLELGGPTTSPSVTGVPQGGQLSTNQAPPSIPSPNAGGNNNAGTNNNPSTQLPPGGPSIGFVVPGVDPTGGAPPAPIACRCIVFPSCNKSLPIVPSAVEPRNYSSCGF